jgi:hypothetical protein
MTRSIFYLNFNTARKPSVRARPNPQAAARRTRKKKRGRTLRSHAEIRPNGKMESAA